MVPTWLNICAWISMTLAVLSALLLIADVSKRPQHMQVMNWVWPLCALFGHLLIVWIYYRFARANKPTTHEHQHGAHHKHHRHHHSQAPSTIAVVKGSLHCGSGCTLGDIIAETLAFHFAGIAVIFGYPHLFSQKLFAIWIFDFILALFIGIIFQYLAIKPMHQMSRIQALTQAIKADILSLTSWQVGMYGFMAIAHFYLFAHLLNVPLTADLPSFWLMMQLAMCCGLLTAMPVNRALIKHHIKEAM